MHMDDGSMPKKFQKIPIHGFQVINLYHLHPFSIFLTIHTSIDHFFYGEVHNDALNMLKKFQVNPFCSLGDMYKTSMLQEVVLNYYRSFL